jgi:DNA-binding transcriptional MocR family regulator
MDNILTQLYLRGMCGHKVEKPEIVHLTTSYDRHVSICEGLGYTMRVVGFDTDGPDMNVVQQIVRNPNVVGMVCVPTYSNPTGHVYSAETVDALVSMQTANPEFRLFIDDAYRAHHLVSVLSRPVPQFWKSAVKHGQEDRVMILGSTSKMTFPGAGVAAVAMSERNLAWFKQSTTRNMISPNFLAQLQHVLFLKDVRGINQHMAKHRTLIAPKFDVVDRVLRKRFGTSNAVRWTNPEGGYFMSVTVLMGSASRIVASAKTRGVLLTPASAGRVTGWDPDDHIRLSPTGTSLTDLGDAMPIVADCIEAELS